MPNYIKAIFPGKRSLTNFALVALCSQLIYAVLGLKIVAIQQMQTMWGVTATELGGLLSISGLSATISYIFSPWFHNRYSIRFMLSTGVALTGLLTFLIISTSQYWLLVILFVFMGLLTEGYAWPAVLNAVRVLAHKDAQGKGFGIMELLRGLIELAQNSFAIWLFVKLGESVAGLKGAMATNGAIMLVAAAIVWKTYPEETYLSSESASQKNKESLMGMLTVLKLPEVWLVGITGAAVYSAYVAIPFFQPFLTNEFGLSLTMTSLFALFNGSTTRMLCAPVAGFVSDNVFKGSANAMRYLLGLIILTLTAAILIPRGQAALYMAMGVLVGTTVLIYFLRPLYFVPVGEMNMPFRITGSAMAVASLLVYSPTAWGYIVYGYVIDHFPGGQAYNIIFSIMIGWAVLGIISASILKYRMTHKKEAFLKKVKDLDMAIERMSQGADE